jgi:tRNA U55 pseudouridine synthase TruB
MRSIARDLGELLGCGACISAIRRTKSTPFTVEEASTPENLSDQGVLPWDRLLPRAQICRVNDATAAQLRNGNSSVLLAPLGHSGEAVEGLRVPSAPGEELAIYHSKSDSRALGLLVYGEGRWTIGLNIAL